MSAPPLIELLEAVSGGVVPEGLAGAVGEPASPAALVDRLGAQPRVVGVTMGEHLVKTEPPLRELVVELVRADGAPARAALDLAEEADGRVRVVGAHPA